jgi:hypothetical protein
MNRRLISNAIQTVVLFIVSAWIVKINPNIAKLELIQLDSLIEIHFIVMGLSISLVTFVYSIIKNFVTKDEYKDIAPSFTRLARSINLNIKRMLSSFVIIVVFYFLKDIDISFIKVPAKFEKNSIIDSIKLFSFFYISLSFIDIILCTLKLYDVDLKG